MLATLYLELYALLDMVKIDGIENPEQWVTENPLPTSSEHGVHELLSWVADLQQEADTLVSRGLPVTSERHRAYQLRQKGEFIMYVLRCAFADAEGGRSERPDYFKIVLQAIKDKKAREKTSGIPQAPRGRGY